MSWEEADTRANPHPYLAPSLIEYLATQITAAISAQSTNIQVTNNNMDGELISTHLAKHRLKRITSFR